MILGKKKLDFGRPNLKTETTFWPISPHKNPKSKTYGANGQYVSKNSELVFGVLIHGDNRISKAGSKKGIIHFEEHPICIKI